MDRGEQSPFWSRRPRSQHSGFIHRLTLPPGPCGWPAGSVRGSQGQLLPPFSSSFASRHCLGLRVCGCLSHGHSLLCSSRWPRAPGMVVNCHRVCWGVSRAEVGGSFSFFHLYFHKGNKMHRKPGQGAAWMTCQLRRRVLPRLSVGKRADRGSLQQGTSLGADRPSEHCCKGGGAPSLIGGEGALQK